MKKEIHTMFKAWTDYPFIELGDTDGLSAPVREIEVVSYDGDKYCHIKVRGTDFETTIKSGYIYLKPGRYDDVPHITRAQLHTLEKNDD